MIDIFLWLFLGAAGYWIARQRSIERFGEDIHKWTLWSVVLGPITLLAAIIYYCLPKN